MKEYINTGLLTLIAGTIIYAVFIQKPMSSHENHQHSNSENSQVSPQINSETPPVSLEEPQPPSGPKTSIKFDVMEHDFGKVKQDSENKYIFKFTNTGSEPLIISNARGSCGCTVPKYPKEPIAPGATGDIEVEYKPGKQQGNQTKTVTITANTEPYETVVQIKAEVLVN